MAKMKTVKIRVIEVRGNDRCRPPGLLGRLGDRFQPDKGNDGQGRTIHKLFQCWELGLPLEDKEFRLPCEEKPEDDNRGFGDDIDGANDLIEEGRFPDTPDVKPDEEHDEDK